MDMEEVKTILRIKTDKHDEYLNTVIPLFVEQAQDYCNDDFKEDGELDLPGGVQIGICKWVEQDMRSVGLQSRSMGSVSYSYDTTIPESIKTHFQPYRKVRW